MKNSGQIDEQYRLPNVKYTKQYGRVFKVSGESLNTRKFS